MASSPGSCFSEAPMAGSRKYTPVPASRDEQIEELMQQLRPKMEEALRRMVERAVDVPEHEEFGAIEYEFRDAGLNVANEVRQAHAGTRRSESGTSYALHRVVVHARQAAHALRGGLRSGCSGRSGALAGDGLWRTEGSGSHRGHRRRQWPGRSPGSLSGGQPPEHSGLVSRRATSA